MKVYFRSKNENICKIVTYSRFARHFRDFSFLILMRNLIELNEKQFSAIKLNYKFGFAPIQLLAATSIHVIHFQNNAIGLFYGLSTLRGVHNVRT